ncbi:FAD:protein FMN transferase [Alicyclobacillus sp. ALC3]|uniref:FAD:protein FMN transferase n=1 Tax=Alicyclobacillus sp. ALC3 TaxID=2796143 RepID=UPI0023796BEF|nr:FAD:protein FMN transferase [Alicyclobacillus sp. ALC3]WDL96139.1 FAD:protein FMN transferase [Alicyclobacillus sp. ALC3]
MAVQTRQVHLWQKSALCMGTLVRLQVVTSRPQADVQAAMDDAFDLMRQVEAACTRFDPDSELMQLSRTVGRAVPVTQALFSALEFALEVANYTDGRFDPTVGRAMEQSGFDRHYLTGETVQSTWSSEDGSWRDIELDAAARTVLLKKPVVLDLGAVAKGLAVDLAAETLRAFDLQGFSINAGGDVYVSGRDEFGEPWLVGVQHPTKKDEQIACLRLTDCAVCTSGSYERRSPFRDDTFHILRTDTLESPTGLTSLSAIGPYAMMCDAFSTAAYLYGVQEGLELLQEVDLAGIAVTDTLRVEMTESAGRYLWDNRVGM